MIYLLMIAGLFLIGCTKTAEVGSCYEHKQLFTFAKVTKTYRTEYSLVEQVEYSHVSLDNSGKKSRDNNDEEDGFREIYPNKIDCLEYDNLNTTLRLNDLELHLKNLASHVSDLQKSKEK